MYGSLGTLNKLGLSASITSGTQEQHNLLPLSTTQPRFALLPISTPVRSTSNLPMLQSPISKVIMVQ